VNRRTLIWAAVGSSYSMATILLISLQLAGAISWPWLWVFSPVWLPIVVLAAAVTGLAILGTIVHSRRRDPPLGPHVNGQQDVKRRY
jgi:hypothetical protein